MLSISCGKCSRYACLLNFLEKPQSNWYWILGELCPRVTNRPQLGNAQIHWVTKHAPVCLCLEISHGCYHFWSPQEKKNQRGLSGPSKYTKHQDILNLSTAEIWGWILLCWGAGCPAHYRAFSSIRGLYPLDASSTHPPLWWPKMLADIAKSLYCSVENNCTTVIQPHLQFIECSGFSLFVLLLLIITLLVTWAKREN